MTPFAPIAAESAMQRARRRWAGIVTWMRLGSVTPPRDRRRDWLLVAVVGIPMVFNAIALWPEVAQRVPNVNDDAFHQLMIRSASEAIARGEHVLDSWGPEMDLGAPRFLYYQNLPAVFVIALDRITFGQFDLYDLLNLTRWALMVGFPLTVYWSARRLELSPVAAAGAAAASSLLSADHRYGIEYDSFVWRGWGMYTQLWAIHLSFITVACLWQLARTGRGAVAAIVAASALVVSHLLYAEMMVVTGAVVFLVGTEPATLRRRVGIFAVVGIAIAVITSYLWVSYLQFGPWVGESPYDAKWKLDSFGYATILDWLWRGELYDHGRWPIFTIAAAVGLASLLFVHTRARVLVLALSLVWLVLYFGREVWGPLAPYIPAGSMLLFHRFIGSFHVASILLIGMGFELVWLTCSALPRPAAVALAAVLCIGFVTPAMRERQLFYADNATWMGDVTRGYENDPEIRVVLDTLRALPPGRTYAGMRANWGERFRIGQIPWYRVLVFEGMQVVSPPLPSINLNSDLMFHFNDQDPASYDLFDVRYVVMPGGLAKPDFLTPLLTTRRYAIYRAPSSGAATLAAQTVRRSADNKLNLFFANRAWLLSAEPSQRSFIRWDYPAPLGPTGVPVTGCAQGAVTNEVLAPDSVSVVTTCPTPGTLVFKTTYHPNWHVTIDGIEQPAFMASPSYVGVEVPEGRHEVRAEYRTSPVRTALLILGGATLVAVLVWGITGARWLPALQRRMRAESD